MVTQPQKVAQSSASGNRSGLTLYEVILSLIIFLMTFAALSELISSGRRAGVEANLQSEAILRCESKMAEVMTGAEALTSSGDVPFSDSDTWFWSMEQSFGEHEDLLDLTVTVFHLNQLGKQNMSYSLRRFIRDPQVYEDAIADEAEAEAEDSDAESSGGSGQ